MSLWHGFKAEASRIAERMRQRIGLRAIDPLDIDLLSKYLKVPICTLSGFRKLCPDAVRHLTIVESGSFSAVTIPCGPSTQIILHNDSHALVRQRSNLAHEFAHIILDHPMTLPLDNTGCRYIDRDIEHEANWLGGVLLVTDAAALHIVRTEMPILDACNYYGVSRQMLRFRLNTSGAHLRYERMVR